MPVSVSKFINGFSHLLKKKKKTSRFPALGWIKEKTLKHQDHTQEKQMMFGPLTIAYKRPYEVLHTYKELFEDEIYNFKALTESPSIIDCGANIGLSVLYFKSLYPGAKIIAYEPDSENFAFLQKNIALNNLSGVECRQTAVWINNDDLLFSADGTQGSGIVTEGHSTNVRRIKAERLADVLKNTAVDFLKIDIEGAELEVVEDCAPYLHQVRNLFVEYHGKADQTEKLSALLTVLKDNFQVYIKMAADSLMHPFVEKSTGSAYDVQLNIFCYRM